MSYDPLLPLGRHVVTLAQLREICVDPFVLSTSRPKIADGLEGLVNDLVTAPIDGELWIDGSFVTSKIDPSDVDIVLRVASTFLDNANADQLAVLELLHTDLKPSHHCDAYVFSQWPEGHPLYWRGEYSYAYWMKQWGWDRDKNLIKGMAVVQLNGGFVV